MENPNNLKECLLPSSLQPSQEHHVKRRRIRRSRTAPHDYADNIAINSDPLARTPDTMSISLHPSLKKVAGILLVYLGVGVICFYLLGPQISGKKTNDIVDAFYFCVVTMTSVGYGDLFPNSVLTKLVSCVFVFSGMALVGIVLSEGAQYLVEKQEMLLVRALHARENLGRASYGMKELEIEKARHKCLFVFFVLVVLVVVGTIFLMLVEKLDFVDAFYCVCATITSLGYGDRSFSTEGGRAFAVVWILISTICLAQFLLYVAEFYTEMRRNALVNWVLTRQVTKRDLEAADMDNDGHVEAAEFVLYKLKEMGKIMQEDISLVMQEFEELDVDQLGSLSLSDITLAQSSPTKR